MSALPDDGKTEFTKPSDRELVATRVFDADRDLIWAMWTDPDHLPKWLTGPEEDNMVICEVDLRPGGSWRFGWKLTDGSVMEMTGAYREVGRPARLVYTEAWGGDWAEALNTLELSELDDGRTLTVATVLFASEEARERAIGTGMNEGWAMSYDRLDRVLA